MILSLFASLLSSHGAKTKAERDLDRRLARRKAVREARAASARQGVSTEWKRRRQRCEQVFG